MSKFVLFIGFLILVFPRVVTSADSMFRCGNKIVSLGDTKAEVFKKCGEPFFVEETGTDRNGHRSRRYIEKWTYDWGDYQFPRILTFKNGRLVHIKVGKRF